MDYNKRLAELVAEQNNSYFSSEAKDAVDCALAMQREIECLNAEKKVCDYSYFIISQKLDENLTRWAALDYDLRHIAIKALKEIASYDEGRHDGICPYGCDTPNIAKQALDKLAERAANQI